MRRWHVVSLFIILSVLSTIQVVLIHSLWPHKSATQRQTGRRLASDVNVYANGEREVVLFQTSVSSAKIALSTRGFDAIYQDSSDKSSAAARQALRTASSETVPRAERKTKPDVNGKHKDTSRKSDHLEGYTQVMLVAASRSAPVEDVYLKCSRLRPPLSSMPSDRPVGCHGNDRYRASSLFCLSPSSRVRLVVLILSAARNYERRQEARTHWLRSRFLMTPQFVETNAWAYAFIVGTSTESGTAREMTEGNLEIEACHYRDILRVDVQESYRNLTRKKMAAFKYLVQSGIDFQIVLKTDDDCYINMQLILEWLPEAATKSYKLMKTRANGRNIFYSGHCPPRGYPSRNVGSKWSVTTEEYNNTVYPAFCFGAGYFLSRDLLDTILNQHDLKQSFHLEDVHTGVLVNDTGLFPRGEGITQALRVYNFPIGECGWRGEKRYPLISSGSNFEYRLRVFHAFMNQIKC